jgi:hypothetical protein
MRTLVNWWDNNGNKFLAVACVALAAMQGQNLMDARWAFVALAVLNAIQDQAYRGGKKPDNWAVSQGATEYIPGIEGAGQGQPPEPKV